MESLLDINFNAESSLDGFDPSSDLLLPEEFGPSLFEETEDESQSFLEVKIEPKSEPEELLDNILLEEDPLSLDGEPTLFVDSPDSTTDLSMFDVPFMPQDLDFLEFKPQEPIPVHCAPPPAPLETPAEVVPKKRSCKDAKPARPTKRSKAAPAVPEPKKAETKKHPHGSKFDDDKYQRRLVANKRSAQASRERKKALRCDLEDRVTTLTQDNASLAAEMDKLHNENLVLKREFVQLQQVIKESALLSSIVDKNGSGVNEETPSTTAASIYLMVVLYSFSQYFKKDTQFHPTIGKAVPSPLMV